MAVDWVSVDDAEHPFPDAPEPKRRFVPSKWESKMVGSFGSLFCYIPLVKY